MSGVTSKAERNHSEWDRTAVAPDSTSLRSWRGAEVVGSSREELCPERGHNREQSFELAAWAARSWVDPRRSLEISGRANARELSCLERGQARHRTEVR